MYKLNFSLANMSYINTIIRAAKEPRRKEEKKFFSSIITMADAKIVHSVFTLSHLSCEQKLRFVGGSNFPS